MKLIDLEERSVTIAGRRFKKDLADVAKFGDMRELSVAKCWACNSDIKVMSGFTGKNLSVLRIESRCKCGSDVDQIDFSKVHRTIITNVRDQCERNFLTGIRVNFMENCCSETKACTSAVAITNESITPYDCVCTLDDGQKKRLEALSCAFKDMHTSIKNACYETGQRSAADRCVSEALTNLETAWEFARKAITLEGKCVER